MKTRNLIALATFSGLLVAAGCTKKDNAAADTAGTAAMTDTGMSAGTTGSMAPATTGTMTDSTGMTTGTMDSAGARPYGDTIKR